MATKLLERTAIQLFKDDSLEFETPQDDLVRISLPLGKAGVVSFEIFDHENGLLEISVQDFVTFLEGQETYAAEMCNKLNIEIYGKFLIDKYRDLSYYLDVPVAETAGPSDFREAWFFAISSFTRFYSVIMTVRWANATVEQALVRQKDGKPGTPVISDEQIRRILSGNDSEEDDTE